MDIIIEQIISRIHGTTIIILLSGRVVAQEVSFELRGLTEGHPTAMIWALVEFVIGGWSSKCRF